MHAQQTTEGAISPNSVSSALFSEVMALPGELLYEELCGERSEDRRLVLDCADVRVDLHGPLDVPEWYGQALRDSTSGSRRALLLRLLLSRPAVRHRRGGDARALPPAPAQVVAAARGSL